MDGLTSNHRSRIWQFGVSAILLLVVYSFIFYLSQWFGYGGSDKPIMTFVVAMIVAAILSWFAIGVAIKIPPVTFPFVSVIFVFALVFRGEMMFAEPILEIDFYRYLWDGKVGSVGESPYRFSPAEVLKDDPAAPPPLQRLSELACQTEANHTILSRVHFKEYTTIYPPVSQIVFWAVTRLVPSGSSVFVHVLFLKTALVLFDLGAMVCMAFLIRKFSIHPAWLIAYGWNPLVIKEIANSAHLDSIAVFFMMAAITMIVGVGGRYAKDAIDGTRLTRSSLSGLLLALGVGAKLFPIVLFPALMVFWLRHGWKLAGTFGLVFMIVSATVFWPYIAARRSANRDTINAATATENIDLTEGNGMGGVALGGEEPGNRTGSKQKEGLSGFLSRWRMNDTIFSFTYYNCRPDDGRTRDRPWFVFVPNSTRKQLSKVIESMPVKFGTPAYAAARIMTLGLFAVCYVWLLRGFRTWDEHRLLEICFLSLALFLLFQPTQNPWYWVWAMPLICFVRNRGWLVVTAIYPVYYSRFWLKKLESTFVVGSFEYTGTGLFDHVVVWFELVLLVVVLICFWFGRRKEPAESLTRNPSVN